MKTQSWYAWLDLTPPKPDEFHVVGDIFVSNPGIQASLHKKNPQGINPKILLLDLLLIQQPGMWPQVMTWVHARYDRVLPPSSPQYESVEIFLDGKSIKKVPVDIVQ
jgi:hypothetical protein